MTPRLSETVLMLRAAWPSTICPAGDGLHAWREGVAALICGWCGEYIVYEDCGSYRAWTAHWMTTLAPQSVLN